MVRFYASPIVQHKAGDAQMFNQTEITNDSNTFNVEHNSASERISSQVIDELYGTDSARSTPDPRADRQQQQESGGSNRTELPFLLLDSSVNRITRPDEENPTVCTGFKGKPAEDERQRGEEYTNGRELREDRREAIEFAERAVKAMRDAAKVEEFKVRWEESVKSNGLDKTPLGPVVKELGQQLAAGKLDVEKLQKLMKDIKMDGEEGEKLMNLLKGFNEDMLSMYGMKITPEFKGKNLTGLTISEAEQRGTTPHTLTVPVEGKPEASKVLKGGIAPSEPTPLTVEQAVKKLNSNVVAGRQDIRKR